MVTKAQLEQENIKLKEKIASSQNRPVPRAGAISRQMDAFDKIRRKGRVEANTIQVKEFTDHKNISLWTKYGKRIGPLHPHNAEQAYKRFWRLGVELLVDQPTEEEIKEYNESPEGIERIKKEKAARAVKERSKGSKSTNKMVEELATMTGKTVEAINSILQSPQ